MNKYIYFHVCCINNWEDVVGNILHRIKDGGLYEKVEQIRCGVLGAEKHLENPCFADRKIEIALHSENTSIYEFGTLNLLHDHAQDEDFYVLYLHSKGVSKPSNVNVRHWTDYMLHFNVYLHELAIDNLKYNDCCGVNYQGNHYSGNFWWSKSSHIRRLNKLSGRGEENYVAPETWLTSHGLRHSQEQCKPVSLWTSGVRHYIEPYPREKYENCQNRYDDRLKRLLECFDYVLINNYGCGFSSSNLLETQKVLSISPDDKTILFYRNVFLRAISTFVAWFTTGGHYTDEHGRLLQNLESCLIPRTYREFLDALEKRRAVDAFRAYLEHLHLFYEKNNYTMTQVSILEHYDIGDVDYLIELENNDAFRRLTGIQFPFSKGTRSNPDIDEQLLNVLKSDPDLQVQVRTIYKEDIEFFGHRNVVVDSL